jgi:hypothetical protein
MKNASIFIVPSAVFIIFERAYNKFGLRSEADDRGDWSGRAMMEALIAGESDPAKLARSAFP